MTRPPHEVSASREPRSRQRDVLQVSCRASDSVVGTTKQSVLRPRPDWPPVPDLFDVITYFHARGDSYTLIASIGFWVGESPAKADGAWAEAVVRSRA
jgi:hypothetical protein